MSTFQSSRLDKNISKEEYFSRANDIESYRPQDRFYSERRPISQIHHPGHMGVSGGVVGAGHRYESQYVNQSRVPYQYSGYESQRISEPVVRVTETRVTQTIPITRASHVDSSSYDYTHKHLPKSDKHWSNKSSPNVQQWKEQNVIGHNPVEKTLIDPYWIKYGRYKGTTRMPIPENAHTHAMTRSSGNRYLDTSITEGISGAAKELFTSFATRNRYNRGSTMNTSVSESDDPFEIVEAMIKVQRVNPRTGAMESFHEEGLTTTLKIHRHSLTEHGLKWKDESILSFLTRKKFDLDRIIDNPTKEALKRTIGLSPYDNIKLELLPNPNSAFVSSIRPGEVYKKTLEGELQPYHRHHMADRYYDYPPTKSKKQSEEWHDENVSQTKKPSKIKNFMTGMKGAIKGSECEYCNEHYQESGKSHFNDHSHSVYDKNHTDFSRREHYVGSEGRPYGWPSDEWREGEHSDTKKPSKIKKFISGVKEKIKGHNGDDEYDDEHYPETRGSQSNNYSYSLFDKNRPDYITPVKRENPVSFEDRSYNYKPYKYEGEFYQDKSSKFGHEGHHSRGFVDRPGYYDKGFVEQPGFQDRGFQDRGFQDRGFQDRGFQDRGFQDRGFQSRNEGSYSRY